MARVVVLGNENVKNYPLVELILDTLRDAGLDFGEVGYMHGVIGVAEDVGRYVARKAIPAYTFPPGTPPDAVLRWAGTDPEAELVILRSSFQSYLEFEREAAKRGVAVSIYEVPVEQKYKADGVESAQEATSKRWSGEEVFHKSREQNEEFWARKKEHERAKALVEAGLQKWEHLDPDTAVNSWGLSGIPRNAWNGGL